MIINLISFCEALEFCLSFVYFATVELHNRGRWPQRYVYVQNRSFWPSVVMISLQRQRKLIDLIAVFGLFCWWSLLSELLCGWSWAKCSLSGSITLISDLMPRWTATLLMLFWLTTFGKSIFFCFNQAF